MCKLVLMYFSVCQIMSMCRINLSCSKTQALSFHSHYDLTTRQSSQSLVYAFQDKCQSKLVLGNGHTSCWDHRASHSSKKALAASRCTKANWTLIPMWPMDVRLYFGLTYQTLAVSLLCENLVVPVSSGKRLRFLKLWSVLRCP